MQKYKMVNKPLTEKIGDKELTYEDSDIKIWSVKGHVDDEASENDIKIDFMGEEYTLVDFVHFYDKEENLVISLRLVTGPLRLLYYIHKEDFMFVDMKELFDRHHQLEKVFEQGSVPLER